MAIYDKPTKTLMAEWAKNNLSKGQVFSKALPTAWFADHYPKIRPNTVGMHVEAMAINSPLRRHHPSVKPGSGHDLFFKVGSGQYRLWDKEQDGPPKYKEDFERGQADAPDVEEDDGEDEDAVTGAAVEPSPGSSAFAFERDLKNYLVKNLATIEPGLKLYEEEGITGVEYPVGGRFIDILCTDKVGRLVVVELKVSRGYDRVVGQLLRYMAWIEKNLSDGQPVRGIIVASEITSDLKLATSKVQDVKLVEYEIEFRLKEV